VSTLAERYSLSALPAIPDITGLPTIIDQRVLAHQVVYVEADAEGQLIRLQRDVFTLSLKKARTASFVVPLCDIHCNLMQPAQDLEQVNRAIEKFTSIRIKQRLDDTLELPPLPQSAQDILRLRTNPDASADELADIVERDPSLAAQVVSWASSSFYNAPGKVKSVHDAIIRVLGFDMVMNLAMGLALGRTLEVPKEAPQGYAPYWQQAMWMALGTTAVISKIEPAYRPGFGLAYLSGLLHNFGYLVLAHVFPPHFSLICRYIEANPHVDPSFIEQHLLGITREQVVSLLLNSWNMPEEIVVAVRHQKNPHYEGLHSEYSGLLCLTQNLLSQHGVFPAPPLPVDDALYERLHITPEKAEEAIQRFLDSRDEVSAMANLLNR
jgi:HD-like signal output (HDOD) protein